MTTLNDLKLTERDLWHAQEAVEHCEGMLSDELGNLPVREVRECVGQYLADLYAGKPGYKSTLSRHIDEVVSLNVHLYPNAV